MPVVAIIPARFASTRLPGKPLSDIHGKPMIQHVYERVQRAQRVSRVLVATDDERIVAAVLAFGGQATMTSSAHASGSDRLAEVVSRTDARLVANVQGDEPLLDPAALDAVIEALEQDPSASISTLSAPLSDPGELLAPDVVKVVTDASGHALYFSRGPIPHVQQPGAPDPRAGAEQAVRRGLARKHVGIYVYRREALLRFAALPRSPLEQAEGLEQLRALQHGLSIRVVAWAQAGGVAVDTPRDLERARALIGSGH